MVKITAILILLTVMQANANVFAQKASIKANQIDMKDLLDELHEQTGYHFLYLLEDLKDIKPIDINVKNASVENILNEAFLNQPIKYSIRNNRVLIEKNNTESISSKSEALVQEITVTGKVLDENGVPLVGVTVKVKNTTRTTFTDANGAYSIKIPKKGDILVFSNLGFQTDEISAVSENLNVNLLKATTDLDQVVIVGYGTSSKRKINSAISTLPMDNVAPIPVASINDAIAGRVQGVIVTSSTGAPGAKSTVSIRGGSTPLYVIDNIIRSQNDFQNINPNDIESYSVLKDAAATALYGAQGGNGVILVSTKKGKVGQTDINYSFNQIWTKPTIFPKRVSSYENLNAINQVYIAENRQQPTPDDILEKYRTQSDPFLYPNTDWQKVGLKNVASEQRHDLSLTSGTEKLTYYASGSYFKQGSILRTDNNYNERVTYRLNTVSNFDNINLKVTTGIDGFVETNSIPVSSTAGSYSALFQHIQQKKATELAYNEFGLPANGTTDNPAVELSDLSGYNKGTSRVFNSILGFDYAAPFLEGLHLKAFGSYNMWNSMNKRWSATAPSYALNSTTPILGNPPSLTGIRGDGYTTLLQGFVTYNKTFDDHNFDFTGVYEYSKSRNNSLSATRQQYQIIYDQFIAGPTVNQLANGSEAEDARAGYVGRLSYNYKSKYFFDGSIRYDGLDLFPTNRQWGTFYALSGGYALSEESFMQKFKDNHSIDYLKIRGSFGLVGTGDRIRLDDGTNPFLYIPGYNINPNVWVINGLPVQGSSEPGSLPSTNYSWFSIRERNIGIDYAALNNRLSTSIDYFYKRTTGYVVGDTRYSAPLGIGLPPINFDKGAQRRHGTEFNVSWNDQVRDFSYKVGLNFTYFNQLWERNPDEDDTALKNPYTRSSGKTNQSLVTGYYGDGFYTSNSDLMDGARRISSVNVVGGDLRYHDLNGDGKIDGSDQRLIGSNTFPRINFGTTIDLSYKAWSFSTVIMGSGNRDRYIGGVVQGGSVQNLLVYDFQQDYWRPDNQNALFPRQVSSAGVNGSNNYVNSDFWILPSKFVRLKYLQFGYDFKLGTLKESPFKTFRLFVSGTNLLTSSNSKKYFIDPESSQNNEDYPIQRTIALGLNVGF